MKFREYTMESVLDSIIDYRGIDYRGKTPKKSINGIPTLSAKSVKNNHIDYSECYFISESEYRKFMVRGFPQKGDVLLTTEAPMGLVARLDRNGVAVAQRLLTIRGKKDVLDNGYLLYLLQSPYGQSLLKAKETGTTVTGIKQSEFRKIVLRIPDLETQKTLDDKIELNNQINKNLEEQAQALYQQMFETVSYSSRRICQADECFDISIGKTPPRKEPEWFSFNPTDVNWVSISDMGNCGLYISSSSERLTLDAVKQHNIKMVPDNTVLLSFKLTVGRVAITNGEMTTNEAIAHFKTENKDIVEYLYFYLKGFNFQTMGSTSSIAVAVNSKMIKAMPFVMPDTEKLLQFHSVVGPMFAEIKANQVASNKLKELRDSLLPKLMSGEIDIDNVEI